MRRTRLHWCLFCAAVLCGATTLQAQHRLSANDERYFRHYTHGVACNPERLRWLTPPDTSRVACLLGMAALQTIGDGGANQLGVPPSDTSTVRCALFFDGSFVIASPSKRSHEPSPEPSRYWAVSLIVPDKGIIGIQFSRERKAVAVYREEGLIQRKWPDATVCNTRSR